MRKLAPFMVMLTVLCAASLAVAQEKRTYSDEELAVMPEPGPNPFLSFLPVEAEIDWNYWHAKAAYESRERARHRAAFQKGGLVAEVEPNNNLATAQVLATFGTGAGDAATLMVSGAIDSPAAASAFPTGTEDEGSIPLATTVVVASGEAKTTTGNIGDGPNGSAGTGTADFDFFEIENVMAGDLLSIDVTTAVPNGDLDPNAAIWDDAGNLLAFNEDINVGAQNFDSAVSLPAPADGTYYMSIGGWKAGGQAAVLPGDPFDSGSGTGAASEGDYTVVIGRNAVDVDCFGLNLEQGDAFGANVNAALIEIFTADGTLQMGSGGSAAAFYPPENPLPGGNSTIDFAAFNDEQHGVCVQGDVGPYTLELGAFRQVFEGTGNKQILFVDFDGEMLDASIFAAGGNPNATLSPLSAFLAGWGFAAMDENALIDGILASLEESITNDLAMLSNPAFDVEIRNSRDHADTFGTDPNVSRLIVGGTIAESGISTIGIAESIDPGNFGTGESALILLDLLSAPASNPNSLNQFAVDPGSTKLELVATGVGNITAHEAGHYLGNWHTENSAPSDPSIMDRGGNLAGSVGVGADGIFGTGDDFDVDFTADTFAAAEGFTGTEHTGENTALALTGNGANLFADGFESGDTTAWTFTVP